MSELMNVVKNKRSARLLLLDGASALTLLAYASLSAAAQAQEDDAPTVWVELGTQLERMSEQSPYAPLFLAQTPQEFQNPSPLELQHSPRYGFGGEGKITITPEGSNWTLSAAVRFGRSNGAKDVRAGLTEPIELHAVVGTYSGIQTQSPVEFANTNAKHSESHAIVDFNVGRDVGLGVLSSKLSAGVRIAQFQNRSNIQLSMIPSHDVRYFTLPPPFTISFPILQYPAFVGGLDAQRSFRGIGPSVSWEGSTPLAGNSDAGQISLDWGLNAAVLFGRQKTKLRHHTTGRFIDPKYEQYGIPTLRYQTSKSANRSGSVTVPNLGGFGGLSFRYSNAKISVGYRGDIFFNAMDEGIDSRERRNLSFHGPFATISVGLGG